MKTYEATKASTVSVDGWLTACTCCSSTSTSEAWRQPRISRWALEGAGTSDALELSWHAASKEQSVWASHWSVNLHADVVPRANANAEALAAR